VIDVDFLKDLIDKPELISDLKFEDVSNILKIAKKIFENENLLLEFHNNNPDNVVFVIGDVHGNLETLIRIFKKINETDSSLIIFLGDIVDRGSKQLECLIFVLTLKILNPHKFYLLRGNHETLEMNQRYGFWDFFIAKFNDSSKFNEILAIYNVLPFCAIINGSILCLHGGIPQDNEILNKLRCVKTKNIGTIFRSIEHGINQIMWNDPKKLIQGFTESFRGLGIKFFGEDVFENFLNQNDLKFVIRSHECFPEGYRWFFNNRLLSIFSSANYRGFNSPNPASYALIENNEIIPQNVGFLK